MEVQNISKNRIVVFDPHLPTALNKVQECVGNGYVASFPLLVAERTENPENNFLWWQWFTANSEELVGKTRQGNYIVIEVHGGGILAPKRIEQAYKKRLINGAVKLDDAEIKSVLEGDKIPVYSFNDFKKISNLPAVYAVVLDFNKVKNTKSGIQPMENIYYNPLAIARAGGEEKLEKYLDIAGKFYDIKEYGNRHPFNDINPEQSQGSLLFLVNCKNGFCGDDTLISSGRFLGIVRGSSEDKDLESVLKCSCK